MKIKRFRASSMNEVMQQIKQELGSDAIILNSKEVKSGGIFGLFQKRIVEVVAALDKNPIVESDENEPKRMSESPLRQVQTNEQTNVQAQMLSEIRALQSIVTAQQTHKDINIPAHFKVVYDYLITQSIQADIAKDIIQAAALIEENIPVEAKVQHVIASKLSNLDLSGISFEKQIIQFVGPTGVGKTTTLAKVAAHSMLHFNKKIAFITTDTYRIAAIDQLKTYARILNVPLEVAYSKKDYEKAIHKFRDYDLIFVDTAGRNFRDKQNIEQLKSMIHLESEQAETYLVISLTAKKEDVFAIYDQFKPLHIKNVIYTKLDETASYGTIVNVSMHYNIGVAYLTNGQDVPDDIVEANNKYISELVMSHYDVP